MPKRKKTPKGGGTRGGERRRHLRQMETLPVFFQVISGKDPSVKSSTKKAVLKDLAAGGICFLTEEIKIDGLHISYDESPVLKNTLLMKIPLPPPYGPVVAMGEVVWFERPFGEHVYYAVGVQFLKFHQGHHEILRRFLKERG